MCSTEQAIGRKITGGAFYGAARVLVAAFFLAGLGLNATADTRIVLLGTSGGPTWWPDSKRMGTSSALVVKDDTANGTDRIYIVDLGPGSAQRLGEAFNSGTYTNIDGENVLKGYSSFLKNVKALFFTHLHMDHTTDFPTLLLCGQGAGLHAYPDAEADKRLQVYGPGTRGQLEDVYPPGRTNAAPVMNPENPAPGAADMTQYLLQAYAQTINNMSLDSGWSDFSKLLGIHEIPMPPLPRPDYPIDPSTGASRNTAPWPNMDPISVYEDSFVKVTATLVNHGPVYPSFAFRFDTADGSVVFSGDTGYPCTNLVQLAQDADVLVHEAIDPAFIENLFPPPLTPGAEAMKYHLESSHTSIFDVGKHATTAGVGTLVLNHIVPGNTPESRLLQAGNNFSGRLVIGADLMEIDVGAAGVVYPPESDFDGDRISDLAVFDPATGNWYIRTLAGTVLAWAEPWGWPGAVPVSGDFDGDGVADLAVFDPATGNWYIASLTSVQYSVSGIQNQTANVTGKSESAPKTEYCTLNTGDLRVLAWAEPWGWPGAQPIRGDFDGDGAADLAVFDPATGNWYIRTLAGTVLAWAELWGWPGAVPVSGAR